MEVTPFTDIYEIFLNSIRDLKLTNPELLNPDELGDILSDYLFEAADVHFRKCKKDLNKRSEDSFDEELSGLEKRILAKGMKVKWLNSNFIANEQLLKTSLTTNDYKVYSPANQLRTLMQLEESFLKDLNSSIMRYQYDAWIAGDI